MEKEFLGNIVIVPLRGMEKMAEQIVNYLVEIANVTTAKIIIPDLPRFNTGDAKAVLAESVRGKDVYLLMDVGNYACTYSMHGITNHMSPDEHYQDLIRVISAIGGKAARINVISPMLYAARQDRRILRESLDCAVALQNLYSIGVENIMAFDVHDDRVSNAVPFMGFDKLMPTYQTIKAICHDFPDVVFDEENMVMISPDFGGMGRNYIYSNELGLDLGVFYKRRSMTDFVDGHYAVQVHKYIGPDVRGKDVLIVDDIIASGDTILDVVVKIKEMGARRIFVAATFGLFTAGTGKFDRSYEKGELDAIFVTNASYRSDEVISAPWYREVNIVKYTAYYIYSVNTGCSIAQLLDPHRRIHDLVHKEKILAKNS